MHYVAGSQAKMPLVPHVKTCCAAHFKLAVASKVAFGCPHPVLPGTVAAVGKKRAHSE